MKTKTTPIKRVFLLAVVLLSLTLPIAASTAMTGWINKDTTLSLAGSPYIVTDYTGITYGHTMTIESGVVMQFNGGATMHVYGNLLATGATFKSNSSSPTPGIWNGFRIGASSDTANVVLTDCYLEYGNTIEVYQKGNLTLVNTDMYKFSSTFIQVNDWSRGVTVTGGSLTSNSTNVPNNPIGININSRTSVALNGVRMEYFSHAVRAGYHVDLSMTDVVFKNNEYPIYLTSLANLTFNGTNDISGNIRNGVGIGYWDINENWSLAKAPVPYLFQGSFTVNQNRVLQVASGNVLKFNDGCVLYIYGGLVASASPNESIAFTSMRDDNLGGDSNADGTASAPGSRNWYGIRFYDASIDSVNVLRRCLVRYAGGGETGGISLYDASPVIDQCNISNNYFGVYMQGMSNPILTNTTIGSSELTPLAMSFEANPVMTGNTLSFSDNDYDAIGIIGGTLSADARLKIRSFMDVDNLTYLLLGEIYVPAGRTLTIDKGITIKAYDFSWRNCRFVVDGTLIADATADSMINFTSARDDNVGLPGDCNKDGAITSPQIGDWYGFVFNPGSAGILDYCRIKYARLNGYGFPNCSNSEYIYHTALALIDASPTISNCEFKDLEQAISCYRASSPVIQNVDMVNILYTPINLASPANPTISGVTFTNVVWRALGLLGGQVCLNGNIKKRNVAGFENITYVLLANMTIQSGSTVNIDPGVVIKGLRGSYSNYNLEGGGIYVDGALKVNGTSAEKVIFTSLKDDNEGNPYDTNNDGNASTPESGDWSGIKYRSTSMDTLNLVRYASVKYPGYTDEGGITFENAGGLVENVLVTNSSDYGLFFNGNSAPAIQHVSIQNCGKDPIAMSLTSNPQFSEVEFVSNFSKAIKIIEGTLSSVATLSSRDLAGITNIGYVIDKLTIASGAKLTIEPGVVIKFRNDDYYRTYLNVYGNLIAKGTPNNKIYFTSFKDDSRGGDSNNNGNSDSPEPGDWGWDYNCWDAYGGICFFNNTQVSDTVNVLKNCEISYAQLGVRVENAHATIDSCVIQLCQNFGLTSLGSANPDVRNVGFYNIGYTPVELSMFSEPVFTNITALNVGYLGLAVVPETYSKSATIPVRNFAGYDNITYLMEAPCTINSGCTITIPAGVSFKSMRDLPSGSASVCNGTSNLANGFIVNGRLIVQGTLAQPVVFTHAADDSYGSPADFNQNGQASKPEDFWGYQYGNWIVFNDVSDDSSRIENAVLRYGERGVLTNSASPKLYSNRFEEMVLGIDMNGVSTPVIDSCVFNNLHSVPIQISLVAYPASTKGNRISGSTYKVIQVRDETLTQDAALIKREFGGKENIPYLFNRYEIGTSSSLTIEPGVICKFTDRYYGWNDQSFHIYKGLSAVGGPTKDSMIVFTSIKDDFYGGDSNSDSTASAPDEWSWHGLYFADQSLDPLCHLRNCVVRYSYRGLRTFSANPTIESCVFNKNAYGIAIAGASNPTITNCDFNENYYYGVYSEDKTNVVQAVNCWWGSNAGPIESSAGEPDPNRTIEQEFITSHVNAVPWRTTGILNPLTGDVSLNGLIQAYDASLVLKNVVGSLVLAENQQRVADVSGNGSIQAYDASLILQYVVGLDNYFPVNRAARLTSNLYARLLLDDVDTGDAETFTMKIRLSDVQSMRAAEMTLGYDPGMIKLEKVMSKLSGVPLEYAETPGVLKLALASATILTGVNDVAELTFRVLAGKPVLTNLNVLKFQANETDMTAQTTGGSITIGRNATQLDDASIAEVGMRWFSNLPARGSHTLIYTLDAASGSVSADIFNLAGQKVLSLYGLPSTPGTHKIQLSGNDVPSVSGIYFIRMRTANFERVQKFQVSK